MSLATDQNIEVLALSPSAVPSMFLRDAVLEPSNSKAGTCVDDAGDLLGAVLTNAVPAAQDCPAKARCFIHLQHDSATVSSTCYDDRAEPTSGSEQAVPMLFLRAANAGDKAKEQLASPSSRRDDHMADAVRRGLEIDAVRGSVAAWIHMVANGIPVDTIVRVLTSASRRDSDPPFLDGTPRR